MGGEAERGIAERLSELGVRTVDPAELVVRPAELLRERGVSLGRLWVGADILHPTIGARTVSWSRRRGVEARPGARSSSSMPCAR